MSATRILGRADVEALLEPDTCRDAVEEAFRLHGTGEAPPPGILGIPSAGGGFHVKAGLLPLRRLFFAAKVNGNFPANARLSLPRIQGVVVLCDGETGAPLALLDSASITALRTAAATAVAARHLSLPEASVATIIGCGVQARAQLRALSRVRPLRKVFAFDVDSGKSRAFAAEAGRDLGLEVLAVDDPHAAARVCAIVVTCTPSRAPILLRDSVSPGAFVAGVGADSEEKQELSPDLLAASTLVTDVTAQCAVLGDLHHAIEAGAMRREEVHAELGQIVAGAKPGRRSAEEIVVFDSTGMALQDAAAAAAAWERAEASGRGALVELSA